MLNLLSATSTTFLTPDMFAGITDAITSGLTVLVPVGVGIFASLIGITLIPKVIYKFL